MWLRRPSSCRAAAPAPAPTVFFLLVVAVVLAGRAEGARPAAEGAFLTPSSSSAAVVARRRSSPPSTFFLPSPRRDDDAIAAMRPRPARRRRGIDDDERRRPFGRIEGEDDRDRSRLARKTTHGTTRLKAQSADGDEEQPASSSLPEILILVFPLLLIYVSNQWSRYSISYLVDFSSSSPDAAAAASGAVSAFEAMNVDLQFTQSQYGLLASTAFTILFALSSLFAGNLADKYDRKVLTLASCAVWTAATIVTSQARSYEEVLAARVIMGGACAFAVPAAYTLIADRVSRDKLALSNSIYGSGVYLGGALASLSLLLDENVGWRGTLGVIGGFGAVSAAAAGLLLPSDGDRNSKDKTQEVQLPDDPKQNAGEENSLVQNTKKILSIPRVQFLFLASFLRFCSGLMIGVWAAPYYKQAFPDNASEYSVVNAFIVGGMGLTSGILGGYVADKLGAWIRETKEEASSSSGPSSIVREFFDEQSIPLLLPIVGSTLAIPAWYLTTHAAGTTDDAFKIAMFWLAAEYLVAECWFGPTIAVLQSTVGDSNRGTAQGLFVLTGALGNLAPTILGGMYGNQITGSTSSTSSSEVLANLLGWGVCGGYLLSSIFFVVSVRADGQSEESATSEGN